MNLFEKYLRNRRKQLGLPLRKVAAALDIEQSTLSKIENGKSDVPVGVLLKLSTVFQLDLKKLEHEYFSKKIAEIIYLQEEPKQLLKVAEEKAKYMRIRNQEQGKINF